MYNYIDVLTVNARFAGKKPHTKANYREKKRRIIINIIENFSGEFQRGINYA